MATAGAKEIKLSHLLKEKFINLELQGGKKNEVLSQLVDLIAQSRRIKNKKAVLRSVLEREKLGSTGIGNGVAIPHVKSKFVGDFTLALARINTGMDFGALDGEKTFLFFCLASPEEEVGMHLKILAEISRLVKDKFVVDLLLKAKNKKEVLKVISQVA